MYNPPTRGLEYVCYVRLISQADTKLFQVNPTLAAGDVKICKDDGAPANLATLPVVDADHTTRVKVTVSATEMQAKNISLLFTDVAGAEWCDACLEIQTNASILGGIATTGGSTVLVPTSLFSGTVGDVDQLNGRILLFDVDTTTAALRAAGGTIVAHTNSATPTFELFEALKATPAAGDTFHIL